jgi:hypothetical protein
MSTLFLSEKEDFFIFNIAFTPFWARRGRQVFTVEVAP